MSENKTKSTDRNDDLGITVEQLASLYNTTIGDVWQEVKNNDGVYMGMRYDSGTKKFYGK